MIRFAVGVGIVVVWCALIQVTFSLRLPFHADEFQGAHAAYRLASQLPYRDFLPYKTVLGYYYQLLPMLAVGPGWSGLLSVRLLTSVTNAAAVLALAWLLARWYRREAVLLAMLLLVFVSTFLDHAFEIRVDMLTGWFGTFALLALMARSPRMAGGIAGLAFLISQKGAFYIVAGCVALAVAALIRVDRRAAMADLGWFVASAAGVLGLYLAAWAVMAGLDRVISITFSAAADVGSRAVYDRIRLRWLRTAFRNPLFYLLAGAAVIRSTVFVTARNAAAKGEGERVREATLVSYTLAVTLQMLLYPQPWSYFFLLLIPILAVCIADLLSAALLDRREGLGLPHWGLPLVIGLGILYPSIFAAAALETDITPQRTAYHDARSLLVGDRTYWAGSNVFADRDQPAGLEWLDKFNLVRLANMSAADRAALFTELRRRPPAVVIYNYRIGELPEPFGSWVERNYAPLGPWVWTYRVRLGAEADSVLLAVPGRFAVTHADSAYVDGTWFAEGSSVILEEGTHVVRGPGPGSLQLTGDVVTRHGVTTEPDFFRLR